MKLCRYGPKGQEKPGIIDRDGAIRDLSGIVNDIGPDELSQASLSSLAGVNTSKLPVVEGNPRYGVPFAGTRQFIAIGLNYEDHAIESNLPIPEEPVVFNKWVSCLQGPNDPVIIPKESKHTDWEVELGIVIGTEAHDISEEDAFNHIAGFCVVHDVSERHWQMERGATWDKGKGFPTFGPVGPWLVTADEVGDHKSLAMWLDVNGKRMQDGSTSTMIFDASQLVSYVSRFATLLPGDIITTGTPPGVGLGQKPSPIYLKAGDVVSLGIEKLGEQRQNFIATQGATS
jgi:2-keto-4-pentenoate hydratase/2-oxohepta-3-ene-1,7-dioic acid hydratase in catechol pathway